MPRTVVLFDLDLTLLSISVDRDVIVGALEAATGVEGILDGFDYRGRSDRWLVSQASPACGIPVADLWPRYADAYTPLLRAALAPLPSCALLGAAELLDALSTQPDVVLAVSTGNMRRNALVKLEHARLAHHFDPLRGGFGDDHDDRADIVRSAVLDCGWTEGDRLVVVGDTVHDVRSALAAGALPVGVATGHSTAEELRAAGAAVVLASLADADMALRAILGRAALVARTR